MNSPLPKYSGRGNRLRLDRLWLEELKERGFLYLTPASRSQAPDIFYKAIKEFNESKFWECHDTLEKLWLVTPYPMRLFYQGLIKVAVGFYHVQQNNPRGGISKLSQGLDLMKQMPPTLLGVDVESLWYNSMRLLDGLKRPQYERYGQSVLFPKIVLIDTREVR